jgi:hypothetical protein
VSSVEVDLMSGVRIGGGGGQGQHNEPRSWQAQYYVFVCYFYSLCLYRVLGYIQAWSGRDDDMRAVKLKSHLSAPRRGIS